jgi:methylenetetrahydrofolate--tRNA-(uracil-5-)-methyltransferase
VDDGEGDYLNCPLTRDEYEAFYQALVTAESATVHDFDKERFFEGCLPIEVMAHRGRRYAALRPDEAGRARRSAHRARAIRRRPAAAGQPRRRSLQPGRIQTRSNGATRRRVLRMIPGLEAAEFVRFGMVHRNTYVNGPTVLAETWQVRARPSLFFAGRCRAWRATSSRRRRAARRHQRRGHGKGEPVSTPPRTTAIGALAYYVSHANPAHYEPSNITFGIIQPLDGLREEEAPERGAVGARARRSAAVDQ